MLYYVIRTVDRCVVGSLTSRGCRLPRPLPAYLYMTNTIYKNNTNPLIPPPIAGTRGLSLAYLYMLLGLGALKAVTPDFGLMAAKEAALEGVFRNMHARLR